MKLSIIRLLRHCNLWTRVAAAGAAVAAIIAGAPNALAEAIRDSALQQISALQMEKASRTPAQQKMDSQLIYALKQSLKQVIAPGVTNLLVAVHPDAKQRVQMDLTATVTQDLLDFIRNSGGTIVSSVPGFDAVRALVPLSLTETLAGRADVRFVRSAVPYLTRTGSVDSEGDTTHRAIQARPAFNASGLGVKVGVLSDSVDYMDQAVASGDLPPNVTVLPGQSGIPATGEGTAMLEIIYDLAPGAQLFYATGQNGEAQFAQNVLDLRAAGCDIIVDDIGYFDEPPFQDGIVARAVNTVTADGALYFSAAGNEGNLKDGTSGTWEGDFADGGPAGAPVNGKGGTLHSFGANAYDNVTAVGNATILAWSDPQGASTNDYDLYVLDSTGATVVSASTTVQNGTQNPFEMVPPPLVGQRVVVVLATGTNRFLHIDTIRGQLEVNTAGNIIGHAAATNAFACAAVDVHTAYPNAFTGGSANPVEVFSTDGPRLVFYNADGTAITPTNFLSTGGYVRPKPDISAADGVSTTLPPFTGLNPFYGTSAAAPHAGAIAALLKSYNPDLTPTQIRTILTSTALDNEALGYDYNSGYGIVMAYQALQAAPAPRISRLVLLTNTISGGNGNGIIEFNECNNLTLVLFNAGAVDATGISATLFTTTPGVAVAQPSSTYADIPAGGSGMNLVPFKISTAPSFVCGTPIDFSLLVRNDQGQNQIQFTLPTGAPGNPLRFDNNTFIPIPSPGSASSSLAVSGVNFAVNKVTVSLFVTEILDYFLELELIAPDGTTNLLSANNGLLGQNYGSACGDSQRTSFDDAAPVPIASGIAPFIGSFMPSQPLSVFAGRSGTNINGVWQLRATDSGQFDIAAIQCWSLFITPTLCTDGGGQCPGADMALGMTALPNPVIAGNNLTYNMAVTNIGPSITTNVIVTQVLPTNVTVVSVSPSQGSFTEQSSVITFSLGPMAARDRATLVVTVQPNVAGTIVSTATVSSEQPDFNPGNNSVSVQTLVTPATADLAVGIAAVPNPVLNGSTLTYTVTLVNNGPSPATAITVTNALPFSVQIQSVTVSQGTTNTLGNVVFWDVSRLAMGATATATITVRPTVEGLITATSTASAAEFDPVTANNTATITTTVGPACDLALSLVGFPDAVVVGSNVTYTITVTNQGPSSATGVIVNDTLPALVTVLSTNTTQGTISISNRTVICTLGTLTNGASATITIVAATTTNGTLTTTASVAATQADSNPANNSATVTTTVSAPYVNIVPAGAVLTYESGPTNGAIDIGETVTLSLGLRNIGNSSTRNLVATLLATNGVAPVPPNTPQTYGELDPSGPKNTNSFTFKASGTNGDTVSATLLLQDGTNIYPPVSFVFNLPYTLAFANTDTILIPDPTAPYPPWQQESGPARPYPSVINVSNFVGLLGRVTVTLSNLSHTFPGDINALLVAPGGGKTLLMSHAGDLPVSGLDLTFDDSAPTLPPSGTLATGTWHPMAYPPGIRLGGFPSNAPAGPYPASLAAFNGANPNGSWSLYVFDDNTGDAGSISNGWSLMLSTISPVNQVADLGLSGVAAPNPALVGTILTYVFTITNFGPNTATFVSFTNVLPAGVTLVSSSVSQGSVFTTPTNVIASLGTLNFGAFATVTNVVALTAAPISPGLTSATLANTANVVADESDLNPVNNTVTVLTTIDRQVADLSLAQAVAPDPVPVGFSLTNAVTITNLGPGTAVNAMLTQLLPPGAGFIAASSSSTVGTLTSAAGTVTCALGNLASNATALVTIVLTNSAPGLMTNTVTLGSDSSDPNPADNSATYVATVVNPAPQIVNAGAVLTYESGPVNGVIDPGETVTLSLALANIGSLDTVNLQATLLPSGGVTSSSEPQSYGALVHGGPAAARSFTFTSAAVPGGATVATLQLQDGTLTYPPVTFTFASPAAANFSSAAFITIPSQGTANPYPATINISGLDGRVSHATVTLHGLTHSFPHDIDVVLASPAGTNVLFMSHTGGGYAANNVNLTFDDAVTGTLPNFDPIISGTYKPSNYQGPVALPGTAPSNSYQFTLSAFDWNNPNGVWSLYVYDDTAADSGVIAGGWSLSLTNMVTVGPVNDLAVSMAVPATLNAGDFLTNTITVANLGPDSATGVVLTNTVPAGVTFVSASLSQGNLTGIGGGQVACDLGSLAAGGSATAIIVTAPYVMGSLVNVVNVVGSEEDLNPANNSAQAKTTVSASGPAVLSGSFSSGYFQLTVTGQPNTVYVVQASTNLTSWVSLSTTNSGTGTFTYTDTTTPAPQSRFYRTVRQ
jgi:uncharacterized repeat protein (TIGR01451 family)